MTLDEIITKCNIGEDHLTQEEYEQVGRWLEDYKVYKKALAKACEKLARSLVITNAVMQGGTACIMYDCGVHMKEHLLQKAREEDNA